ncbi:MAG TPA: glycosyltransferase family 2 protein [Acidimicrobiia bacterium]|nr:glycosyltransferase family 2 protein [Acidimicrobiia bacterium]
MTRILIIMPALNEEESLRATLKELREVVDGPDILVIDDGSTDATAEVASRAGALSAQLPFTLGVGGAVRVGLHYAQRNGYDRAVVIDADGQHDPAGITALLEALDHGADMAVGSRFAAGTDDYPVGRTRRQAMRFLGAIVRALTGQRFSDVTSGFRAFDRPVIELLAREYPVEYLADTVEALLLVRYAGFRVDEVPISMRPRAAGEPSTRRLKLVINYLRLLIGILGSASRRARLRKDEA